MMTAEDIGQFFVIGFVPTALIAMVVFVFCMVWSLIHIVK